MSEEQTVDTFQPEEEDLEVGVASEDVGLEELADGQGIAEAGASVGMFGCCSFCRS